MMGRIPYHHVELQWMGLCRTKVNIEFFAVVCMWRFRCSWSSYCKGLFWFSYYMNCFRLQEDGLITKRKFSMFKLKWSFSAWSSA